MSDIHFLTFETICEIHDKGIADYGEGTLGILDEHAIRSASGQPEAGMLGEYFHEFPAGMAAAYLYYLTNQQGFLNGNKRTAVGSALLFLSQNGFMLKNTTPLEVYEITVGLAGENIKGDRKTILSELTKWIDQRLAPIEAMSESKSN